MKKLFSLVLAIVVLFTIVPLNYLFDLDRAGIDLPGGFNSVAFAEETANTPKTGDVDGNGKVESADARLVLRASVGLEQFSEAQNTLADVDFDSKVTSADARLVLRASVGLEVLAQPAHEHSFVVTVVNATCTEKGYTEKKCSGCGYTEKGDYTDALGHTWDNGVITKAATCQEKGIRTYTCTVCKETKTEEITGDHSFVTTVVKATCTEKGYTENKCSVCGKTEKSDYTDALGHTWDNGVITKAATCQEKGIRTYTCTVCKETKTEEITGDHSFVTTVVKATCTEKGYTETKCSVCGKTEKSDYTDALGHTWDNGVISTGATCIKDGIRTFTCTVCQATKTETIKGSHTLVYVDRIEPTVISSGSIAYYHCSVCGQNFYDYEARYPVNDVVLPPTVSQDPLTAKQIYNTAVNYTVEINVEGPHISRLGTGFVYSSDGKIITNYHVIDGATSITVTDINGNTYDCINIIGYDETLDIAIIQVDATSLTAAPLCYEYDTGDVIYTLGSSEGLSFTLSDGLISNKQREDPDYKKGIYYIQISAPISHGNSGGPLIDAYGRVIGINTWGNTSGQNLNFSLPLSYISQVVINTIPASEFYSQNSINAKKTAFYAIASLIMQKGEYVDGEIPSYRFLTTKNYETYTVFQECSYILANSEKRIKEEICFTFSYWPLNTSVYTRTTNVYITSDLFINGQFVLRNRDSAKSYYSYFVINSESFVPDQTVSFYKCDLPDHLSSAEKIAEMEAYAGYDATTALMYAQSILDYYNFKYNIADLGFVNFAK